MIQHVTYHVPPGTLANPELPEFMGTLGFTEVKPDDPFEHGWNVRWWENTGPNMRPDQPKLHLVEGEVPSGITPFDRLCLGHFCVTGLDLVRVAGRAGRRGWLERDSGSGRIWLAFGGLRVEVRP